MLKKLLFWAAALGLSAVSGPSFAEDTLSAGDTSWMIVATVLVIMMSIPGLALFYGGLVRTKNMLSVLMQVFAIVALMSILWAIAGYSLAFTEGPFNSIIGGFDKAFLAGITPDTLSGTIPEYVFVTFQLTFACITPALIIGAFAERIKFSAVLWFSALWLFVSYIPICHMVWGGGYLGSKGALDFAGGTVVHINAAIAGLVICLVLGKRLGYGKEAMPPHNLPFTMVGAALLWVGWFGFNGGSVLSADPELTSLTLVTTSLAAAAGGVAAAFFSNLLYKNFDLTMFMNGILGGLVSITASADQVSIMDAMMIGAIGGIVVVLAVSLLDAVRLDDPVGAVAVHLFTGIWGTLAVGIFGTLASWNQFLIQLTGAALVALFCITTTAIFLAFIGKFWGLRVDRAEELEGLDQAEHGGMHAYADFRLNQH